MRTRGIMVLLLLFAPTYSGGAATGADCQAWTFNVVAGKSEGYRFAGRCGTDKRFARGDVFTLQAGGRLTLMAAVNTAIKDRYEVICDNDTGSSVRFEITGAHSPWITPIGVGTCRGWLGHRLSCGPADRQTGIFCTVYRGIRTLQKNRPVITTSFPVRKFDFSGADNDAGLKDRIALEVNRAQASIAHCKSKYPPAKTVKTKTVKISWRISPDGSTSEIHALPPNQLNQKAIQCVAALIKKWRFSNVITKTRLVTVDFF